MEDGKRHRNKPNSMPDAEIKCRLRIYAFFCIFAAL